MIGKIKAVAAISSLALVATASMTVAQEDLIGYRYHLYADAEKTQYQGFVQDYGCGQSGDYVYVVRVSVPSAYFDLEPVFTCASGQIGPIEQ